MTEYWPGSVSHASPYVSCRRIGGPLRSSSLVRRGVQAQLTALQLSADGIDCFLYVDEAHVCEVSQSAHIEQHADYVDCAEQENRSVPLGAFSSSLAVGGWSLSRPRQ